MTDQPEKRSPGRPPTGRARKVAVTIQVQPATLAWIVEEARARGVSRGAVVDEVVRQARGEGSSED